MFFAKPNYFKWFLIVLMMCFYFMKTATLLTWFLLEFAIFKSISYCLPGNSRYGSFDSTTVDATSMNYAHLMRSSSHIPTFPHCTNTPLSCQGVIKWVTISQFTMIMTIAKTCCAHRFGALSNKTFLPVAKFIKPGALMPPERSRWDSIFQTTISFKSQQMSITKTILQNLLRFGTSLNRAWWIIFSPISMTFCSRNCIHTPIITYKMGLVKS